MIDDKQYEFEESISVNQRGKKDKGNFMDNSKSNYQEDFNSTRTVRNFKVIVGNKQNANKKNSRTAKKNSQMKNSKNKKNNKYYSYENEGNFASLFYILWSRIKTLLYNIKLKLKK